MSVLAKPKSEAPINILIKSSKLVIGRFVPQDNRNNIYTVTVVAPLLRTRDSDEIVLCLGLKTYSS